MAGTEITPESLAAPNTEHAHQCALFYWAVKVRNELPEISLMFAIPNGGLRDKRVAARLKAEGVKKGVPDVCLPVPRHGFTGLWIENKRPETREAGAREGTTRIKRAAGKASDEQSDFVKGLIANHACAVVCVGWAHAAATVACYLGRPDLAPYAPRAAGQG